MWEVEYYTKKSGDCPVEDFLLALPLKQQMKAPSSEIALAESRLKDYERRYIQ